MSQANAQQAQTAEVETQRASLSVSSVKVPELHSKTHLKHVMVQAYIIFCKFPAFCGVGAHARAG
jgi:hypothetical protein